LSVFTIFLFNSPLKARHVVFFCSAQWRREARMPYQT
jgi:hypothetical protein